MTPTLSGGKNKRRSKFVNRMGNALFYVVLTVALAVGLAYGAAVNGSVFGFSAYEVLSSSMEREIPKGSVVVTKSVEAETIQVGDDITFFKDQETKVTHRVIGIYEDYEGSGQRGFETMGVENTLPDDIVYAENVIGKVVWHLSGVRGALDYIKEKWPLLLLPLIGLIGTGFLLRMVCSQEKGREEMEE